jgi:hypothetical protein
VQNARQHDTDLCAIGSLSKLQHPKHKAAPIWQLQAAGCHGVLGHATTRGNTCKAIVAVNHNDDSRKINPFSQQGLCISLKQDVVTSRSLHQNCVTKLSLQNLQYPAIPLRQLPVIIIIIMFQLPVIARLHGSLPLALLHPS